jgi:Flp pilus assembly protein TadG
VPGSRSSPAHRRGWGARVREDRGEIPTTLIIFPALIITFYLAVHTTLVFNGRSVVAAAAQDGLRAAQIEGGTAADGHAAANQTLALSPGLREQQVDVDQGEDTVTVRVSAEVETLIVELFTTVSAEVTGPRERFYSEAERP